MPSSLASALGTFPISLGDALRDLTDAREYTKVRIAQAARQTGLSYWRAFDLWYGKARRIEPSEHAAITAALERKRDLEARNELHELRLRLTRLEALLAQKDRPVAHSDRAADRTMDGAGGLCRRAVAAAISK